MNRFKIFPFDITKSESFQNASIEKKYELVTEEYRKLRLAIATVLVEDDICAKECNWYNGAHHAAAEISIFLKGLGGIAKPEEDIIRHCMGCANHSHCCKSAPTDIFNCSEYERKH